MMQSNIIMSLFLLIIASGVHAVKDLPDYPHDDPHDDPQASSSSDNVLVGLLSCEKGGEDECMKHGLICRNLTCSTCKLGSECPGSSMDCLGEICQHKLLTPLNTMDLLLIFWLSLSTVIASAGGIGGGGLIVPILIFFGGFPTHESTQLSQVTMFGIAIGNFASNWNRKHPVADRPLIDYESVMLFEPPALLGTVIGVSLNKISPGWLVLLFSTIVCIYSTKKTAVKCYQIMQAEKEGRRGKVIVPLIPSPVDHDGKDKSDSMDGEEMRSLISNNLNLNASGNNRSLDDCDEHHEEGEEKAPSSRIVDTEKQAPKETIVRLVLFWIGILVLTLLKGGKGAPSIIGMQCGSVEFWVCNAIFIPMTAVAVFLQRKRLLSLAAIKKACKYVYQTGDIRWNERNTLETTVGFIGAGVCAAALGIGGGILQGPLMTDIGMLPQTVQATSSFMVLFTTATLAIQYWILGLSHPDYAAFLFCLGFVCALVGNTAIHSLVSRFNSAALLTGMLSISIAISAVAMGISGSITFLHDLERQSSLSFNSFC